MLRREESIRVLKIINRKWKNKIGMKVFQKTNLH